MDGFNEPANWLGLRVGSQCVGIAIRSRTIDGRLVFLSHQQPFGNTASPPAYDLLISDEGNVGVGSAFNPQSKLAVKTPAPSYGLTHTDGTVTVGTFLGIGSGQFGTRSNHPLHFFTNDSPPQMTLNTLGNVGIGSFPSQTRLFLSGGPAWTSANWQGSLGFMNASAIGWAANAAGQRFGIGQTNGGLLFFRTSSDFGNTANPANFDLTINDVGNVGIGTITPDSKLTIVGTGANGFSLGTSGSVGVGGNAIQNRDKGGLVKAMIYVGGTGIIERCYNGTTGVPLTGGTSNTGCGFSITHSVSGSYLVDFGFPVNDRFYSATPIRGDTPLALYISFVFAPPNPNQFLVVTYNPQDFSYTNGPFSVIIF